MTWAVTDLETTTKTAYKRKANPFLKNEDGTWANWVVLMGQCTKAEPQATGFRMTRETQHRMTQAFVSLLSGSRLLVGQNIKFDIHYIIRDPVAYDAWTEWVAGGGIVWDCQLAEYLLQGQVRNAHMLSMDDMAMYYGEDLKVDEVKKLWEAGVATEDIDPELLMRYLIGEKLVCPTTGAVTGYKEGDIGVTRNIFLKQIARATKSGQMRSISLNMGALLATIEMERNGMMVHRDLGYEIAKDLEVELAEASALMQEYLPKDLPFDFNWTNRYHLSPLIFGGKVRYDRREYDLKDGTVTWTPPEQAAQDSRWESDYAYAQKDEDHYLLADGGTMLQSDWQWADDNRCDAGNPPMLITNKSGKNAGEPKTKKVKVDDYTKPKSRMVDDYFIFPGFTEPREEWASSTDGLYSVAGEVIEELTAATTIPFLKTLGKVAKLQKDLGTYFITTDAKTGEKKGMLTLVGEDDIVHHSLNHTSTVTGRFSSDKPNLQNIPKGQKSRAKEMFISRFGEGGKIVQSDFSSLEVYVQANLTKSKNLIKELLKGTDLHCLRLSKKEGMTYEDVLKLCKGWKETTADGTVIEHAEVEEWDYKRTGAKVFSFQLAYGAGAKTIAAATGMPVEDVEALILAERELFPEIDAYFEARGEDINRNAKPTSQFVMHPANPAVKVQIMISRIQMPGGKVYSYMSSPAPAWMLKRGITSGFSPTERKNYEVQGEGGEIMKCALWLQVREFYRLRPVFKDRVLMVNTVHDASQLDAAAEFANQAAVVLQGCMEAATDLYCHHLQVKWSVPVPTETTYGPSMAVEKKVDMPGFAEKARAFRDTIRARYMPGFVPPYQTL